jgi:hypothetical protein
MLEYCSQFVATSCRHLILSNAPLHTPAQTLGGSKALMGLTLTTTCASEIPAFMVQVRSNPPALWGPRGRCVC